MVQPAVIQPFGTRRGPRILDDLTPERTRRVHSVVLPTGRPECPGFVTPVRWNCRLVDRERCIARSDRTPVNPDRVVK